MNLIESESPTLEKIDKNDPDCNDGWALVSSNKRSHQIRMNRNKDKIQDKIQDRIQDKIQDKSQNKNYRYQDRFQDRFQDRYQDRYQDKYQDRFHDKYQNRYHNRFQDRKRMFDTTKNGSTKNRFWTPDTTTHNQNNIVDEIIDNDNINEVNNIDEDSLKIQQNDIRCGNYKKILCKNINSIGRCIYTNKCLYAHSLDEQNVESIRRTAYDVIKKSDDLSNIDLSKSKHLYTHLQTLSKLCQHCEEGSCTGGYNCKHGACDKIYVICQTDLNKGTCEGGCGKVHLTKKGLVPYGVSIVKNIKTKTSMIPTPSIINDEFFKKLNDTITRPVTSDQIIDINYDEYDKPWLDMVNSTHQSAKYRKKKSDELDPFDSDDDCDISRGENDILSHLSNICTNNLEIEIETREKKLTRSIFKIDVMCI